MQRKYLPTSLILLEKYKFKYVYSIFQSNRVKKQKAISVTVSHDRNASMNPCKLKV